MPHGTLDDTLGAAFLGHFLSALLYGITTFQVFLYFRDKYRDPLVFRLSVFFLWLLDSAHVALITGAVYWYCITNFANLAAIQQPIWPIPTMIIVSNISNSIVRGIFGYRLYRLSQHGWILPSIIAVLSTFILVDATYFSVELYGYATYTEISKVSWGLYAGLSVEAAVDFIITIAQCILLHRYETGIRSTDSAIRVLMAYAVNTGLLTSICGLGALVAYATLPDKFVYFAFYFALSKLYVNSLLAAFNARGSLLGGMGHRGNQHAPKLPFRTPTATMDGTARYEGAGIEFTTVISADALETDSVVETTKINSEEGAFGYRV
ncbi:hypothetical protein C8Q80DRAFT_1201524 [Daedaleopsis nitida]|nr:hypothetical protein C8Q80DRAFT_1201524 [Daedaleopsis nitida]